MSVEFVGQVADFRDRRDVAVHRIDAFKGDQLGCFGVFGGQQFAQMFDIIMAENALFAARIADARDHAGVVKFVGKDDAAGQQTRQRRQRRFVRDIARREQQSGFLAVQVGQFAFQIDMIVGVAADIARAARTGTDIVQRLFHRGDHLGMLPHGEIVVGAPDSDWLGAVMAMETARIRVGTAIAEDVDEHPIPAFFMKTVDRLRKDMLVVHARPIP